MTEMFDFGWSERPYWDRKNWSSLEAYKEALKTSTTLYVGNLSFYTQESQIYALFDQVNEPRKTASVMRLPFLRVLVSSFCLFALRRMHTCNLRFRAHGIATGISMGTRDMMREGGGQTRRTFRSNR